MPMIEILTGDRTLSKKRVGFLREPSGAVDQELPSRRRSRKDRPRKVGAKLSVSAPMA